MKHELYSPKKNHNLTKDLVKNFSQNVCAGDIFSLNGPLGVGKTQFVKYIGNDLHVKDYITSPTYGLVHFYNTPNLNIMHVDAYRLESQQEFCDLGLEEFFDNHLTFIEWGDKLELLFDMFIHVQLKFDEMDEQNRLVDFTVKGIDMDSRKTKKWCHFIGNLMS